ncbi:MAG TPA: DUF2232 domain-containing protein [bacterium]|nr:DUF2232 domain-containing protein [bacterium]
MKRTLPILLVIAVLTLLARGLLLFLFPLAVLFFFLRKEKSLPLFLFSLLVLFSSLFLFFPLEEAWFHLGLVLAAAFSWRDRGENFVSSCISIFSGVFIYLSAVLLVSHSLGLNLPLHLEEQLEKIFVLALARPGASGISGSESLFLKILFFKETLPSWIALFISLGVFAGFWSGKYLSRFFNISYSGFLPLRFWKIGEPFAWGLAGSLIFFVISRIWDIFLLGRFSQNLIVLFLFLYFCQGLGILDHLFTRRKTPGILRIFFYCISFFYYPVPVFLGLVTIWKDIRK